MYQDAPQPAVPLSPLTASEEARALELFPSTEALAGMLDHTLLRPEASVADVQKACREAMHYRFACVMVHPASIPVARATVRDSGTRLGTVLSFPLGASLPQTKVAEAHHAAQAGARDLDVVLNIAALRSGEHAAVQQELREVAEAAHGEGAILKVILETCLLTEEQKHIGALLALEAGADFVKTSTGFSTGGASVADVQLLRKAVGQRCGVKASGGIRTLQDALHMVEAGANRIGASASVAIVEAHAALLAYR